MSDEEISLVLKTVMGIGQWTVDMFLIFSLKRPDVFPTGDLGIRKGLHILCHLNDLPASDEMLKIAEKCRSLRNICFNNERRFLHYELGWNYRFTNIQAAIGLAQLEKLNKFIVKKRNIGKI